MIDLKNNPIAAKFLETTGLYSDRIALRSAEREFSYFELRLLVCGLARRLEKEGVGRESIIGFDLGHEDALEIVVSVIALALLGAQWMQYAIFPAGLPITITHLFSDGEKRRVDLVSLPLRDLLKGALDNEVDFDPAEFAGYASATDTWSYSTSSGTTGVPKCILSSGRYFCASLERVEDPPLGGDGGSVATLFPWATNGCIFHFFRTLCHGGSFLLSDEYDFLSAHAVNLVVGSPDHLARMLSKTPVPASPVLGEVRVAGAALVPAFLQRLKQYFQVVRVGYAATEVGVVCTRVVDEDVYRRTVGHCYSDVILEIVDDNDVKVAEGIEGSVRVRTPTMHIEGYFQDEAATRQAFKDGWFYPGDRGYCRAGELYITGRIQDHLNASGVKVNAALLDEAMQSASGIVDAVSFLESRPDGTDRLVALVKLNEELDTTTAVENLLRAVAEAGFHRSMAPRNLYYVAEIPRTPSGKPIRDAATELARGLKPDARISG